MQRQRKFLCFLLMVVTLTACNLKNDEMSYAGGSFHLALDNSPSTFDPIFANDFYSATILNQVFEGLVTYDSENLSIVPQIAKAWEISEDGKTYKFLLRNDVLFHDHSSFDSKEDRKCTPEDVVFSFERACQQHPNNAQSYAYSLLFKNKVQGANSFFKGSTKKISGLSISGDTVIVKLIDRDDFFLTKLGNVSAAIVSKKAFTRDEAIVGTGPFLLTDSDYLNPKKLVLIKNTNYYERDNYQHKLPYLDSVCVQISSNKKEHIRWFNEQKIDYVSGLSSDISSLIIDERIADFNTRPPVLVLNSNPNLTTNYYLFNMLDERFANPLVRQAFNFAIDRKRIGKEILVNQFYRLGNMGIVPPVPSVFKGYAFNNIQPGGYFYSPKLAKELMTKAGYTDGKAFGKLLLRVDKDELNVRIAKEIQRQLKQVLNLDVVITSHSFEVKNNLASNGNGDLFRSAWSADYPSPETFLLNFYGKMIPSDSSAPSTINQSRYRNQVFDQMYEDAIHATSKGDALKAFNQAEVVLLQNPPFIPLWYSADYHIIYSNVRNLHFNPLNFLVLKRVYKKAWTVNEYRRKKVKP